MKVVIDLHDEVYNNMVVKNEYTDMDVIAVHNALMGAIRIPEGHEYIDRNNAITSVCQWFTTAKRNRQFSFTTNLVKLIVTDILRNELSIIEADATRDYITCGHSDGGKCAGTEECYEQQPSGDCISRQSVDILVDELARAISDERCCISRGRSTATIMQDILDLPPVTPLTFINKPCMKAR